MLRRRLAAWLWGSKSQDGALRNGNKCCGMHRMLGVEWSGCDGKEVLGSKVNGSVGEITLIIISHVEVFRWNNPSTIHLLASWDIQVDVAGVFGVRMFLLEVGSVWQRSGHLNAEDMTMWQHHPAEVQFASQGILPKVLNLQDEPLVVVNVVISQTYNPFKGPYKWVTGVVTAI